MAKQYRSLHPTKFYRDYLNHGIRPDGREFNKFRPVVINGGSIRTADGSAIVKIGDTTVICGIKLELCKPKAETPNEGFLVPNIELHPICSARFRPGPPSDQAQINSKALYDILNDAKCIDLKDLCIEADKLVWCLYADIICLDHNGCVLDASVLALIAALRTGNPTHFIDLNKKSGIYEISCSSCPKIYIGQTRRLIETRFKEHLAHFRSNRKDKSAVADHIFVSGHPIEISSLKLLKCVLNCFELNAYEIKLPLVKYDATLDYKDILDERIPLRVNCIFISTTYAIFEGTILTDPTAEEESLCSGVITVVIADNYLCTVLKPGGTPLEEEHLLKCIEQSMEQAKLIEGLIKASVG